MPRTASDYASTYRAKRIAAGWKQVNFLLPPESAKKLAKLQAESGLSAALVIVRLIAEANRP